MAKFTVTITVLLFTLALSIVSSKPENEIFAEKPATLSAEPDPDTTNPTLHGSGSGPELIASDEITIPVNFVNFHPINRHFPRRPLTTTVTFNRRPCHHRRHELLRRGLQIPYGNDMIVSGEEKTTGADPSSDGVDDIPAIKMLVGPFAAEETKHHPGREMDNFGEVEPEDNGSVKSTVTRVKLMRRKEEGEGERENLFRRKIRKFPNHLV